MKSKLYLPILIASILVYAGCSKKTTSENSTSNGNSATTEAKQGWPCKKDKETYCTKLGIKSHECIGMLVDAPAEEVKNFSEECKVFLVERAKRDHGCKDEIRTLCGYVKKGDYVGLRECLDKNFDKLDDECRKSKLRFDGYRKTYHSNSAVDTKQSPTATK